MSEEFDFDKYHTAVSNAKWDIRLYKVIERNRLCTNVIAVTDSDDSGGVFIKISEEGKEDEFVYVSGIDGSYYLLAKSEKDNAQSVKLFNDNLILSLGFTLVSIHLKTIQLNWKIRPDIAAIFEFYDLQDDLLLRGEMCIYRITQSGEIVWQYKGKDIWVNIDGKPEVTILENTIRLIDFESNEYIIDFNGKTLKC